MGTPGTGHNVLRVPGQEKALGSKVDSIWDVLDEMVLLCACMAHICHSYMSPIPQKSGLYMCHVFFMKKSKRKSRKNQSGQKRMVATRSLKPSWNSCDV